jgi:hypothetical protein
MILLSLLLACKIPPGRDTETGGETTTSNSTDGQSSTSGPAETTGNPTTGTSTTENASSGTTNETTGGETGQECMCLPGEGTCVFHTPCETAEDCCPQHVPEGFICNQTVPYIYTCEEGICVQDITCEDYGDCRAFFMYMSQNKPGVSGKGCLPYQARCDAPEQNICILEYPAECVSDSDCCNPEDLPEGYTCKDYPFHKSCVEGKCEEAECTSTNECDAHFKNELEERGWTYFGCVSDGCVSACKYVETPCMSDADCCKDPPSGYTCADFPYNRSCVEGECRDATCTSDMQCVAHYFDKYEKEGYVFGGCSTDQK